MIAVVHQDKRKPPFAFVLDLKQVLAQSDLSCSLLQSLLDCAKTFKRSRSCSHSWDKVPGQGQIQAIDAEPQGRLKKGREEGLGDEMQLAGAVLIRRRTCRRGWIPSGQNRICRAAARRVRRVVLPPSPAGVAAVRRRFQG